MNIEPSKQGKQIANNYFEKLFHILSHQGNANLNNPGIPTHTNQNDKVHNFRWQHMLERRKNSTPPLLVGLQIRTTTSEIA